MNAHRAAHHPTPARSRVAAALAVVGAATTLLGGAPAQALDEPRVPTAIEVPAGHKLYRSEHAVGTQNYVCLPSATAPSGFAWILYGPQATAYREHGRQTLTHFLSPNPDETGTPPRATWLDSRDSSAVWAVLDDQSSDPAYVDPNAIPWFRLRVVGKDSGPNGGRSLTRANYLQRINTVGGKALDTGCAQAADVGKKSLVPYEADYLFWKSTAKD